MPWWTAKSHVAWAFACACIAAAPTVWGATGDDGATFDSQSVYEQLVGDPERRSAAVRSARTRGIAVAPAFALASLPTIQFEYDSDRLTATATEHLRELADVLHRPPLDMARFALRGHTDSRGVADYNRDLSLRRAQAVKRYLSTSAAVAGDRLTAVGLGEDYPLHGTDGIDPRNRRVEIVRLGGARPAPLADDPQRQDPAAARALLIGIDDYRHVSTLLGAPINDVHMVRDYLRDGLGYPAENIKTLLDGDATRANILAAVRQWLVESSGPAFLYFSGHGYFQPDVDGDEADGVDETLVPVDTEVVDGAFRGMIADDEIAALLARMAPRRVDVVIDACHSGTLSRGMVADWRFVKTPRLPDGSPLHAATPGATTRSAGPAHPFIESSNPGLTVWTAVRADQKALVDATTGPPYGSVFTRSLLKGLRDRDADANADGTVTARELDNHLLDASVRYCESRREFCGAGLTPQLSISPAAIDTPAFQSASLQTRSLAGPPLAALAKDILVRPTDGVEPAAGVRLRLKPSLRPRLGEAIEIVVESDRNGALVLLDIDAAGRLVQIFPNARSTAAGVPRVVQAGTPQALPGPDAGFRLVAQPPVGSGTVIAVVARDAAALATLTGRHKDLAVVERPDAYLVELAGYLRRWSGQGWSFGTLAYEIAGP